MNFGSDCVEPPLPAAAVAAAKAGGREVVVVLDDAGLEEEHSELKKNVVPNKNQEKNQLKWKTSNLLIGKNTSYL